MSNTDPKAPAPPPPGLLDMIPPPLITAGRYALVAVGSGVSVAAGLHVISQPDAATITSSLQALPDALNALVKSVETIVGLVSLIVTTVLGAYGTFKSMRSQRLLSVAKDPSVKAVVVATPEQAAAFPFNVISVDDAKKPDFVAATIENRIITP